jgi:hypothetical protein
VGHDNGYARKILTGEGSSSATDSLEHLCIGIAPAGRALQRGAAWFLESLLVWNSFSARLCEFEHQCHAGSKGINRVGS